MFNFFVELKNRFKLGSDTFASFQMINLSNNFLYIEGHRGILNFDNETINIKVKGGLLSIKGTKMFLSEISDDTISVKGKITCIELV